jgi:ABC-type sugar transport system permease subunit
MSSPASPTLWQRFNRMDETKFGLILLVPTVFLLAGFLLVPIGYAFVMSFHQIELTISPDWDFAGVDNYTGLLASRQVVESVPRTLYFAGLNIVVTTLLSLALAIVLNEPFRGRKWVRVFILLPWAVAPVVSGVMWRYMFHQSYGLINALLFSLGLIQKYVVWFDDPTFALSIASFATAWKALPFATLIILAAMQSIPESLFRAAKMDGANILQRFRYVSLPHLRGILIFVVVLQTIASLQAFDLIFTLTRGGPGQGTVVLNYLTFINAFERLSLGNASAMAILLALLIILLSGLSLSFTLSRRQKV